MADKYVISLSIEECKDLLNLCDDSSAISDSIYWFSWEVLGETYRSDAFHDLLHPKPISQTLFIPVSGIAEHNSMPIEVYNQFPFQLFLCTTETVLGVATISLDERSTIPYQSNSWQEVKGLSSNGDLSEESAFIKIKLLIEPDKNNAVRPTDPEEEDYGDEDFEHEETVRHEEKTETRTAETTERKKTSLIEEEDEDTNILRHYRVNVEIRTVGSLKRPGHLSVQFMYPYLGASSPVRTHPKWVLANTEAKIDGGSASYECCFTRSRIQRILSDHPLRVSLLSRSTLGNEVVGEAAVDLYSAILSDPHSYRCPLTNKQFKYLEEYARHRQIMTTLVAAGKLSRAPPKEPVIIRATDTYLAMRAGVVNPDAKSRVTGIPRAVSFTETTAKCRVVVIIEEIGAVGPELGIPVLPGYKQHNGALYDYQGIPIAGSDVGEEPKTEEEENNFRENPLGRKELTAEQRAELEQLTLDWEAWRRTVESKWKDAMHEKELELKKKLELDAAVQLSDRADNLKRAHEEAAKLEVRLRGAIEAVERQKSELKLKEEQIQLRLAQKTAELQLLQRRVREEAKVVVDSEKKKTETLAKQLSIVEESLRVSEKRARDVEKEFESYRHQSRNTPESILREEVARLKAVLGESRAEVERERRLKTEAELEKEHFRAQTHRLALALKRERDKSSGMARQELEQLRLEFMSREERYYFLCIQP